MPRCLYNYSAGPAIIPAEVHAEILEELQGDATPVSMLELGHRTPEFCQVADQAEENLRKLLNISDEYAVLFLAGGASAQYAMVPMNFSHGDMRLDYIDSGHWSKLAIQQARLYGDVQVIPALIQDEYGSIALGDSTQWEYSHHANYCHYVDNETLTGVAFPKDYLKTDCMLACDMTSSFLSREIDLSVHGIIYAGAQKNMGTAGITVVIVKKDAIKESQHHIPRWEDYRIQIEAESRYNTPPIFAWYVCGLVLAWTVRQGGVAEMEKRSMQKAQLLYKTINASSLYHSRVVPQFRSHTNVHFYISDPALEKKFIKESQEQGLYGLRGHRAVGGIRASLYNAMTLEGVEALEAFMLEFERLA